jgi:hypothetical protein
MTGIGWLDATTAAAFATVTVLALVRLRRGPNLDHFLDNAFHAVMGTAMTAMFWPGSGPGAGAWAALIGLTVVWPLVVLTLAARRRDWIGGRVSPWQAAYWLACALLLVAAVGGVHEPGGHSGAGFRMASMAGVAPGGTGSGPSALGEALAAVAGWPIWPVVGVGFLAYTGLLLLRPRRPITERACAAVMATGMAVMAFMI